MKLKSKSATPRLRCAFTFDEILVSLTLELGSTPKTSLVSKNLTPLRSGAPPISAEELDQVYADWTKWRAEWIRRRKIFNTYVFYLFLTFWRLDEISWICCSSVLSCSLGSGSWLRMLFLLRMPKTWKRTSASNAIHLNM